MSKKILTLLLPLALLLSLSGCDTNGGTPTKNFVEDSNTTGDSHTFFIETSSLGASTQATLRKIVSNIQTQFGRKTLKIWVSDDCYGTESTKRNAITSEMVDALANAFLKEGEDNDIYDWDTTLYGEEWGDQAKSKYDNLIGATNEINILLTDIDNDNSADEGVIGYFYPKDNTNRDTVSGSNERIMFYIDAVMFANDSGGYAGWDIRDHFPAETLSTLAHEFQHMIHFYQKTILRVTNATSTDTWIDEMLSETTEDIVATKIGIPGPRNVDPTDGSAGDYNNSLGRYPGFNAYGSELSLTQWSSTLADYSKVSAFGTYLIRNHGGAKLLHDIMHNQNTDKWAIVDALPSYTSFDVLLREWGVAILLSDQTTLPDGLPRYNTGDFTETTYNGITYEMGSINFFNYPNAETGLTGPAIHKGNGTASINPASNLFYKIGTQLSSDTHMDINLTANTIATLVVKNHNNSGSNTGSFTTCTPTSNGSDLDINITVGDDPSACYLATGKNLHLDFHISGGAKDLYLVLTNPENHGTQGADITNPNSRHTKMTTTAHRPAIVRKRLSRPSATIQRVQEFKRNIHTYLIPKTKETL